MHIRAKKIFSLIQSISFDIHGKVVKKVRKCDITLDLFPTKLQKIIPLDFLCKPGVYKPVSVKITFLPLVRSSQILFKSVALSIKDGVYICGVCVRGRVVANDATALRAWRNEYYSKMEGQWELWLPARREYLDLSWILTLLLCVEHGL